jgi:hypothetical protein
MGKNRSSEGGQEGLGSELEALLGKAPPPKAPAWFAAKTLARLREEEARPERGWVWRWVWAAGAAAVLAGAWLRWEKPNQGGEISDAAVFAALDALVEQDEENRWWVGL